MATVRAIIQRAATSTKDPATQMQMIRRVLEDIHGGSWGVLIIKNPNMVSQDVHWTIPDHTNEDGSPAFCLAVVNRWQYNIFKTGTVDRPDRVTVVDVVNKIRQQEAKKPKSRILTSDLERFVD
ncbi:unnamed protein product, partial [Mesorhabditis belari]|uniref:Uncharacterized protein n=1 Tax=Mesorhabditis belari TaxID=2138241 RepID=A0AAF3EL50_9BILA